MKLRVKINEHVASAGIRRNELVVYKKDGLLNAWRKAYHHPVNLYLDEIKDEHFQQAVDAYLKVKNFKEYTITINDK